MCVCVGAVLNCVRMLMRIIPFLFEHVEWRDLFWSPIAVSEVCVCVCVCVCARACVHACVCIHVYIHAIVTLSC